ncbi:MAG: hypothetical protein V7K25_07380 [Nostoc sp.]|uniref:hypothetical protein n=1 Tax=Nostoc sp. TaxID=1180 RepID=UPI002FF65BDB
MRSHLPSFFVVRSSQEQKPVTQNSKTGAAFIAGGTIAGAGVSATVGGMGLAGGFGAVGIGATPVVAAGAVAGAAAYRAINAIAKASMQAINQAYKEFQEQLNACKCQ